MKMNPWIRGLLLGVIAVGLVFRVSAIKNVVIGQ